VYDVAVTQKFGKRDRQKFYVIKLVHSFALLSVLVKAPALPCIACTDIDYRMHIHIC
jgi:hypothetical protein